MIREVASARGRTNLPCGFALMLGLIFAVEGFVVSRDLDFVHPWSWDWRLTGQAARKSSRDCDVLCLGDSLVKFGVPPKVLEARLGCRAYNLAIGAATAPASYFVLRRALESGAKPRAIIVDFKPHLLTYDLSGCERHWPEFLSLRETLELSIAARDAGFSVRTTVARLLPSVRARFEIRANLEAAWRGEIASPREAVVAVWRNWRVNRGAQIMPSTPDSSTRSFPWAADLFPKDWKCRRINALYIHKFIDLALSRGVRIYWLLPPVAPSTQEKSERLGLDRRYEAFVRSVAGGRPGLIVVDGRHSGYGQDLHVDPIHLDRRGASALADELAAIIARTERDPKDLDRRWVALPGPRPTTVFDGKAVLEDLDQSRIALRDRQRRIQQ